MTRDRSRLLGAAIMTVFAALGAASCGTTTQTAGLAGTQTPGGSARPPAGSTGQAGTETPKQRAEQDAAAILAAFVAPPGARRLAAPPAALKSPSGLPATPDLIDKAGWWQVAGDPQQVLDLAKAHVPHRFTLSGWGTLDRGAGPIWSDTFDLPAVPGVLLSRQLIVDATSAGSGQTAIRVDAQVIWLPARAPGEMIPAGVTAVALSLSAGTNAHAKPPATVTDQGTVRKLTALVDGLPRFPDGSYSCPMDNGASLVLTFRAGRSGPVLAVATVKLAGCEGVNLTVGGEQQPGLGPVGGGRSTAAKALKIAGLHWSV
jgi:hypothetical protein